MACRSDSLAATLCCLLLAGSAGCAHGDRFGDDGDPPPPVVACTSNADCHDGDPHTIGICGEGGTCEYSWNPPFSDPDGVDPVDDCVVVEEIGYTKELSIPMNAVPGPLGHELPLIQGSLIRMELRDRHQLQISPVSEPAFGAMLVLLSGCANAAANRLDWGESLRSPIIEPGDYYLAAFADTPGFLDIHVRYLEPVTCDDALPIEEGSITGTVDGYSGGFSGSCMPEGPDGHRGNRIYSFSVEEGESRDLQARLHHPEFRPSHYLFLRAGCDDSAVELACENHLLMPRDPSDHLPPPIELEARDLGPGDYFLFVSAAEPDDFDLGQHHLEITFQNLR